MKKGSLKPVIAIYLAYTGFIFGYWFATGADYNNLTASDVIVSSLLVPFGIGAIFIAWVTTRLVWWSDVMVEDRRIRLESSFRLDIKCAH